MWRAAARGNFFASFLHAAATFVRVAAATADSSKCVCVCVFTSVFGTAGAAIKRKRARFLRSLLVAATKRCTTKYIKHTHTLSRTGTDQQKILRLSRKYFVSFRIFFFCIESLEINKSVAIVWREYKLLYIQVSASPNAFALKWEYAVYIVERNSKN